MKQLEIWIVQSDGARFVILNQYADVIAEVIRQEDADRICALVNKASFRAHCRRQKRAALVASKTSSTSQDIGTALKYVPSTNRNSAKRFITMLPSNLVELHKMSQAKATPETNSQP